MHVKRSRFWESPTSKPHDCKLNLGPRAWIARQHDYGELAIRWQVWSWLSLNIALLSSVQATAALRSCTQILTTFTTWLPMDQVISISSGQLITRYCTARRYWYRRRTLTRRAALLQGRRRCRGSHSGRREAYLGCLQSIQSFPDEQLASFSLLTLFATICSAWLTRATFFYVSSDEHHHCLRGTHLKTQGVSHPSSGYSCLMSLRADALHSVSLESSRFTITYQTIFARACSRSQAPTMSLWDIALWLPSLVCSFHLIVHVEYHANFKVFMCVKSLIISQHQEV